MRTGDDARPRVFCADLLRGVDVLPKVCAISGTFVELTCANCVLLSFHKVDFPSTPPSFAPLLRSFCTLGLSLLELTRRVSKRLGPTLSVVERHKQTI